MKQVYVINETEVIFGDACFTLYKVNHEKNSRIPHEEQGSGYHTHLSYELHYFKEGQGHIPLKEKTIDIHPGEAVILPPSLPHNSIVVEENSVNIDFRFSLTKSGREGDCYRYLQAMLDKVQETLSPFPVSDEFYPDADFLMRFPGYFKIRNFCYAQTVACRMMNTLIAAMDRIYDTNTNTYVRNDNRSLMTLLDTMIGDHRYTKKQIAEGIRYSLRNTERIICKYYGKSFKEIRDEQKLQDVFWHLENTKELSMAEIAHQSGFSGEETMQKVCKRKYGCTVEEYAEKSLRSE